MLAIDLTVRRVLVTGAGEMLGGDAAWAEALFCRDAASWIAGQTGPVSGGVSMTS